jgi:hypothetical protein
MSGTLLLSYYFILEREKPGNIYRSSPGRTIKLTCVNDENASTSVILLTIVRKFKSRFHKAIKSCTIGTAQSQSVDNIYCVCNDDIKMKR